MQKLSFIRRFLKVFLFAFLFICLPVFVDSSIEATSWYASPTGTGTTCTSTSPCSLSTVNTKPIAGDTVSLSGGTYTTAINPTNDGNSGNPITYRGATSNVIMTRSASLAGDAYITLDNLSFQTIGSSMWISTDATTDHLTIENCDFTSQLDPSNPGVYAFVGILSNGDFFTFKNNTVGKWIGGDTIQSWGNHALIQDNNFNNAHSGHGSIHIEGSYTVVRRNTGSNAWDRMGENSDNKIPGMGDNLWEDNTFFNADYENPPRVALEGWVVDGSASGNPNPGSGQLIKTGGRGLIFRNNLIVATNPGKDEPYSSILQIGNFENSDYWENLRFYHNTFESQDKHGISVTRQDIATKPEYFANNNYFYNNIISNSHHPTQTDYSFRMINLVTDANFNPNTWLFHNNILTQPVKWRGTDRTAEAFNSNFSGAAGNISTAPTYVDGDFSAEKASNSFITRNNFLLQNGSAGKAGGRRLAEIRANGTNTTMLTVDDARIFWPGWGTTEGDTILVNGQTTIVTARLSDTSIQVNPAVTVSTGQPIWLASYGQNPDIGIITIDPTPTPTPTSSGIQPVSNVSLQFTCISGPSTSNATTLSWTNPPGNPATMVQVSSVQGSWNSSFRHTNLAGATSISLPNNFTEYIGANEVIPEVAWTLLPDTPYYYRIWNNVFTTTASFTIPTCAPSTPGDTNGDNQVNIVDLSTLLSNFGETQKTLQQGDVSGNDGVVNVSDLSLLLARFGM
ncbi:hypothetical protein HY469_04105 [Candidatus Roizmanbacteria bacterium]|nr:hypothetical protein [Candidatus Roizmanbacteria bacterium]